MTVVCKIAISALFCLLAAGCGGVIYPPIQTAAPSASPTAPSSSPQTPPPSPPTPPPTEKPTRFIFAVTTHDAPHGIDIAPSGVEAFTLKDRMLVGNYTRDLGAAGLHASYVSVG